MTGDNRFDDIARIVSSPLPPGRILRLIGGLLGDGVVNAIWPARARTADNNDQSSPINEYLAYHAHNLHLAVAVTERHKLFVHAGVVGWRGKAIVIPGRSGTGKSEMVAALVRAGASYYSDEFAVLDKHGYAHPYDKKLTVRRSNRGVVSQIPVEVSKDLLGTERLPVGLIVVGPYHAGAPWNPRTLTPGEAVLEMLDNTVLARSKPERALAILQRVASGALSLKGQRGSAEDVVQPMLRHLDDLST